jgi:serine/threonine protein kinase
MNPMEACWPALLACWCGRAVCSFGVLCWEIVTAQFPKRGQLRGVRVPEECPAEVEALIRCCLEIDPNKRPTARQAFDVLRAQSM